MTWSLPISFLQSSMKVGCVMGMVFIVNPFRDFRLKKGKLPEESDKKGKKSKSAFSSHDKTHFSISFFRHFHLKMFS